MSVNLVDRVPVPGSFGVAASTNVVVHIQTTGTVSQATITVTINGVSAIIAGAQQAGYTVTCVIDGSGGWDITINPAVNFTADATITVGVTCTEEPGSVVFAQSYTFRIIRNIQTTTAVSYFEEGDVIEADVFVHEGQTVRPSLADTIMLKLLRDDTVLDTIVIDNKDRRGADQDGSFRARWLHPFTVNRSLKVQSTVSVDGYAAPGIGSIVTLGTIDWVAKQRVDGFAPAEQPSLRVAETLPQTEPNAHPTTSVQQQRQAEYEVVDLSKSADSLAEPTLLVDLDFLNSSQYLQVLEGDLSYVGGGNRLLPGIDDINDWFLQESDELGVTFGARTLVEGEATNLLANSDLVVNDFTVDVDDVSIRADVEQEELTSGVMQLRYLIEGSVIFDGTDRNVTISSTKVTLTSGQPVMVSVLARSLLRDATVTLDLFALRIKFWDSGDVQVGSDVDFNYSIADIESDTAFSLIEGLVTSGSIPMGATQVSFDIVIGSWEGCDLANLWLAAPMVEHALFSSSRVVGPTASLVRLKDDFRIQQLGNLNQRTGRIAVVFAPHYDSTPPVNVTLFDTRDQSTLYSGYTLRHRTDGKLELTATDAAGSVTTAISAAAVPLAAGLPVTTVASWSTTVLRVLVDETVVASFSGSYSQPATMQAEISIGQKIDGTEPLYGELHSFRSYGIS